MRLLSALLVTVIMSATACGDGTAGGSCLEVREPEDPLSIQHVIDPDAVVFRTNPPTSGPHLAGPALEGIVAQPITGAAQVRTLESGAVVVQYEDAAALDSLRPLLDDGAARFVIAPAVALPSPVVATAWTWKLTCDGPDVARILEFATARTTAAPGID
ncbi:MAG: DUF3105 domain-containing protein [Acidimicrobiales bacterium]